MNINTDIARTYLFSGKKMTAVAVLGVLLGMSIYIFMNSLLVGFDKASDENIFKNTPHIRLYNDDVISKNLVSDTAAEYLISNPKVVPKVNTIINPNGIAEMVQQQKEVTVVTAQVNTSVFYNNGKTQVSGLSIGIKPDEADMMYSITSSMVEGKFETLKSDPNGIVIGIGIAEKMNLVLGDNINLTSQKGVTKNLRVAGIFRSFNSTADDTKSYVNLYTAQQLLKENNVYVTDISVNVKDPYQAAAVAEKLSQLTGYKSEDWKESNESLMALSKMRFIMINFVSTAIMLIAGFGIYNILNMTVSQKINDIAILKAIGFKGKDVIRIFVTQALSIGLIGVVGGMLMALLMITLLKKVYIGGDIGYFPVDYELQKFIQGVVMGLVITFFAGYIPARKAAKVDPVSIFRK
ncbi:MAG: ABC transporter permease [Paludibacter sp.]|jgi:lipoprotein-releasing system permease protein|uniref:Lipoprotein-releasing system permease protein n=1 Tax=Algoriella xinjiangensis TaxID=684065 RepID=A0A1I4WUG5_9FLAO|nr:FtsX-like permease family protein [Algoriella xinjiangensis]MBP6661766.1 ABC transporter permease [Paludibacter sp.]SFN17085.1 lipoprotein-releasing system permease protein [Algoriella xinjiangensis]HLW63417.1 FtsX-like permease family protein [Flavobacterium sp.]